GLGHGVLEALEVGEGLDVIRGELVLRAAARVEHGGHGAREHGGQHLGHQREPIPLVRALLAGAAQRRLEEVVPVEDRVFLHGWRAFLVRDPAGQARRGAAHSGTAARSRRAWRGGSCYPRWRRWRRRRAAAPRGAPAPRRQWGWCRAAASPRTAAPPGGRRGGRRAPTVSAG